MKTVNAKIRPKLESAELPDKEAVKRSNFDRDGFLLPYFLISLSIHGLIALIFAKQEIFPVVTTQKPDDIPVEFIVVPPDRVVDKPPPETKRRAINNSVSTGKSESKKPPATDKPVNTETNSSKIASESIAKPPNSSPKSTPKPTPTAPPEIKPNIAKLSKPEAAKPTPTAPPEIKPNIAKLPKPEAAKPTPTAIVTSKPIPPNKPNSVATLSPPSTSNDSGAASLLGGNYQRSLQEDAGSSFFNLEANASKEAPYANLDALQNDLAPYFDEIRRRVKRNWQPSSPGEEQLTILSFAIQRNGQITGLTVVKTSGNQEIDRNALEAVQQSAPFAPLPESFTRDRLDIQFNFNIYIDRGFNSFP